MHLPEFATKAARIGKVARVSQTHINYWQLGDEQPQRLAWPQTKRRKGSVIREHGPLYEVEDREIRQQKINPSLIFLNAG